MIVSYKAISEFKKSLKYFLRHYKRRTYATFVASFIFSGFELISAAMILPLISLGVGSDINNPLLTHLKNLFENIGIEFNFNVVFSVFISAYAIKIILELIIGIFIDYSTVLIARDFRGKIISGLKSVSWGYLTQKPHGLFVNLMTQEIDRATGIFNMLQTVVVSAFTLLIYISLGMTVSSELLIAAGLMGLFAILLSGPMFKMARQSGSDQIDSMRNISADLIQGIRALKVFKAMARERELLATLTSSNDAFVNACQLKVRAQRYLAASQQFILIVAAILGLYVARDILNISLVEIGFMGVILIKLNTFMTNLLKKFQAISSSKYALDKIDDFHSEIVAHKEHVKGKAEPNFPSEIKFHDVVFYYDERPILKKISFIIPPKGLTTFIGSSGSGKTTIIDLICGFYKPNEGNIYVGEDDINSLNIRKWRQSIGYVTQDSYLLHQSIAKNVAAFDNDISEGDIEDALKLSGIWKTIVKLVHGVETNAGESGAKLSGGERQRIAIARALAKRPKLLILDEPTSALDTNSEKEILNTIVNISKKLPVIVISHQKIFEDAADTLFKLEDGQVCHI